MDEKRKTIRERMQALGIDHGPNGVDEDVETALGRLERAEARVADLRRDMDERAKVYGENVEAFAAQRDEARAKLASVGNAEAKAVAGLVRAEGERNALAKELDDLALAVGFGERPEGQSGVRRASGEDIAKSIIAERSNWKWDPDAPDDDARDYDGMISDLAAAKAEAEEWKKTAEANAAQARVLEGQRNSVCDALGAHSHDLVRALASLRLVMGAHESSRRAVSKGSPPYDAHFLWSLYGSEVDGALETEEQRAEAKPLTLKACISDAPLDSLNGGIEAVIAEDARRQEAERADRAFLNPNRRALVSVGEIDSALRDLRAQVARGETAIGRLTTQLDATDAARREAEDELRTMRGERRGPPPKIDLDPVTSEALVAALKKGQPIRGVARVVPLKRVNLRDACRAREPLDGADAQALEHALSITEKERDEARSEATKLEAALAASPKFGTPGVIFPTVEEAKTAGFEALAQIHLARAKRAEAASLDGYQEAALRTGSPAPGTLAAQSREGWLAVLALGLAGEAGEVADYLKKVVGHGHPLDVGKAEKEIGDVLWYAAVLAHALGLPLSRVAAANVEKLRARYPDGFRVEASVNRKEGA